MDELLLNVFSLFGYECLEVQKAEELEDKGSSKGKDLLSDFTSRLFSSRSIQDYWLVYKGSPSDLMEKGKQAELLKTCKLICEDDSLDKNLNLLCLWQCEDFTDDHFKSAHLVEEDMYFFKKYVLYFKSSELEGLQDKVSEIGAESVFKQLPLKPEFFTRYKDLSALSDDWSALLYRICIKLTFITLNQHNTEQLTNLKEVISNVIRDKGLTDFERFMERIEDVGNKEPAELLELLDKDMLESE
jgi:hypothetical protein